MGLIRARIGVPGREDQAPICLLLVSFKECSPSHFILFLRESDNREGAERGGQMIQSRLCADSSEPDVGLELTNCEMMTCGEVRCSTD